MKYILMLALGLILIGCGNSNESNRAASDTTAVRSTDTTTGNNSSSTPASSIQKAEPEVRTFQDKEGWGYDIYMNGKLYIHQPHIPAVSGNKAFNNEADAQKAGELVVYKINNNIMPPSVSIEELDSIGVLQQ